MNAYVPLNTSYSEHEYGRVAIAALVESLEIFCVEPEPEPEHPSFHDLWLEDLNRQIDAAFSSAGYTETT